MQETTLPAPRKIRKNYRISKSNPILDMPNTLSLTQQRMLNVYLAMVNPEDESSKTVVFLVKDLAQLIGITEISFKKMVEIGTEAMQTLLPLCEIETNEDGTKYVARVVRLKHLWETFDVREDASGVYVTMEAHSDMLQYVFRLKEVGYGNIPLAQTFFTRSAITEKLYEQCVRYKKNGQFTLTVPQLKERLGVAGRKSYDQYKKFKSAVLNPAVDEINLSSELYISVTEAKAKMRGAPVQAVTFTIKDNHGRTVAGKIEEATGTDQDPRAHGPAAGQEKEVTAHGLTAADLQERYSFTEKEAGSILQDKVKYGLADERVEEVIRHVRAIRDNGRDIRNMVGYIRTLLAEPDIKLDKDYEERRAGDGMTFRPETRNMFNQFEQNTYDFDALEKELLQAYDNI